MKKIFMLSIVFASLLIGGWLVSAEYSCSTDSDCKVHVCSTVCVNDSFTIQQECTGDLCMMTACAIPPDMRPSACKCENNICADVNETNLSCNSLYWFDNENKDCGQKQFCGAYMYYGLRTFKNKEECENALGLKKITCPKNSGDENGKCVFNLSNGIKAEIKIMPETALEIAAEKLGDLGFTVELKEVGKGEETKAVYELTGNKQGRFLGIFKTMVKIQAQVDAQNGDVKIIKPWWSFLVSRV